MRQHIDRAGAEQRPQGHFHRAGIGSGDDAQAPVGGDAEDAARTFDDVREPCLGVLGAVAAAEQRTFQRGDRPAGSFRARTR